MGDRAADLWCPARCRHILGKYLAEWGGALKRRDLRHVQLRELRQILAGWSSAAHHRIVALQSFTAWLREQDRLRHAEDPTLDLKDPQPITEKRVRPKGYTMAEVQRVYAEVSRLRKKIEERRGVGTLMPAARFDSELSYPERGWPKPPRTSARRASKANTMYTSSPMAATVIPSEAVW